MSAQTDQIDLLEAAIRSEIDLGEILFAGYPISVLVALLIDRGAPGDLVRAEKLVAQLENLTTAWHCQPWSCGR